MRKGILAGLILGAVSVVFIMFGCRITPPEDVKIVNQWPRIYLVNVPPDSSHLPHAPIVYWYGADSDGYIIAYQWAMDDTSTWTTLWVDSMIGTEDTIAFSAPLPDTEFTHVFYVRAMDNDTAVTDQCCIGIRVFHVSNIPPVNTSIDQGPEDSAAVFVIPETTATWHGVYFKWSTEDSDQVFPPKFSWKWDAGAWSEWDEAVEKYFTGDDDPALTISGWHTLFLRAMDDAMAIDTTGTRRTIYISMPTFSKQLLVYDGSRNGNGNQGLPTDEQVDAFYDTVLVNAGYAGYSTIDNSSKQDIVANHDTIGQYKIVFMHSDDIVAMKIPEAPILEDYLDVGGRLFIGGYQTLESVKDFFQRSRYLGVEASFVNEASDFVGAFPIDTLLSYLEVDSSKVHPTFNGALPNVGIYGLKNVFNALYAYDSKSDSADFEAWTATMFIFEHESGEFRTAAASFPLYNIKIDGSGEPLATTIKNILDWLNE